MTWSQAGGGDIALAVQNDRVGIVWTENQGDNRRVFYSDDILDTMYQPLMRK
jgi:hypothetical protein